MQRSLHIDPNGVRELCAFKSISNNKPAAYKRACLARHSSNPASYSASSSSNQSELSVDRRTLFAGASVLGLASLLPAGPSYAANNIIDGQGATRLVPLSEEDNLTEVQQQILEINRRTQRQNTAPPDFPNFIREGYDMTILASDQYQVSPEGVIYKDFSEGTGDVYPQEGQQVTFDYTAYNESAAVVDSSYRKGQAAQTQLGIQGLVPGFEIALKSMKPGGKRRIIVPPELGPPVGPSTFFSAKQYEVFDVELRAAKSCVRRSMGMFSDVVCE